MNALNDQLSKCKAHETEIKSMNSKITECQAHQPNIDQMQNQVKDFAKMNTELKSMEKTLRHAMDKVEAPKQKVKPQEGFVNVVSQAEVVGVFDDKGEKSVTSESF